MYDPIAPMTETKRTTDSVSARSDMRRFGRWRTNANSTGIQCQWPYRGAGATARPDDSNEDQFPRSGEQKPAELFRRGSDGLPTAKVSEYINGVVLDARRAKQQRALATVRLFSRSLFDVPASVSEPRQNELLCHTGRDTLGRANRELGENKCRSAIRPRIVKIRQGGRRQIASHT